MRILPEQDDRVETGPLRFGNDWAGVFLRGDSAFGYAGVLEALLEHENIDPFFHMELKSLLGLLQSSNEQLKEPK